MWADSCCTPQAASLAMQAKGNPWLWCQLEVQEQLAGAQCRASAKAAQRGHWHSKSEAAQCKCSLQKPVDSCSACKCTWIHLSNPCCESWLGRHWVVWCCYITSIMWPRPAQPHDLSCQCLLSTHACTVKHWLGQSHDPRCWLSYQHTCQPQSVNDFSH